MLLRVPDDVLLARAEDESDRLTARAPRGRTRWAITNCQLDQPKLRVCGGVRRDYLRECARHKLDQTHNKHGCIEGFERQIHSPE